MQRATQSRQTKGTYAKNDFIPGGVVEVDFDKSISDGVNIYAKRDGFQADFVFLACRADLSRRSWRKAEVRRRWSLH